MRATIWLTRDLGIHLSRDLCFLRLPLVGGVLIKDTTKKKLLYSERSGEWKSLRVGRWLVRLLRPTLSNFGTFISNEMVDLNDYH